MIFVLLLIGDESGRADRVQYAISGFPEFHWPVGCGRVAVFGAEVGLSVKGAKLVGYTFGGPYIWPHLLKRASSSNQCGRIAIKLEGRAAREHRNASRMAAAAVWKTKVSALQSPTVSWQYPVYQTNMIAKHESSIVGHNRVKHSLNFSLWRSDGM